MTVLNGSRRLALAAITLAGLLGTPATAIAADKGMEAHFQHFMDCFDYMMNDEARHIAECGPGQPGIFNEMGNFVDAPAPAAAATTPPA